MQNPHANAVVLAHSTVAELLVELAEQQRALLAHWTKMIRALDARRRLAPNEAEAAAAEHLYTNALAAADYAAEELARTITAIEVVQNHQRPTPSTGGV